MRSELGVVWKGEPSDGFYTGAVMFNSNSHVSHRLSGVMWHHMILFGLYMVKEGPFFTEFTCNGSKKSFY